MNVLVILAGIADPKLPLPSQVDARSLHELRARHAVLSPFDEAALELALKLRDASPDVRITALLAATSAQDRLLTHIASFRLDQVLAYPAQQLPAWQSQALAQALSRQVQPGNDTAFDLVLMGREFGDEDDGSLPAALAAALDWPLVTQAMHVQPAGTPGALQVLHQLGVQQEVLTQPLPAVLAVTNHVRNRLRHPLLKNVMQAKKMSFALSELPQPAPATVQRLTLTPTTAPVRQTACQMLEGDTAAQARALARLLLNLGEPA